MIRPIDIRLNAAHPELPLAEAVTFTDAPSTVLIRGVPPNCGRWAITAVSVAATFPDGSTTTRAAVQSANGVWVATLPATATSGRTANGLRVIADGIDENGAAVTGYILGVADFAVASLGVAPAPAPGETSWQMLYFDATPATPRKGDVTRIDGDLKFYNGTAWLPFTDLSNYYTAEQVDEAIDKLAAYYITYNAAGANFPTRAALLNAQTYYSGGVERTPTRNDYAVVLADETHDGAEWRYIYAVAEGQTVGQWEAQYPIETNDYTALSNKPTINNVELSGNKTSAELGIASTADATLTERGFTEWVCNPSTVLINGSSHPVVIYRRKDLDGVYWAIGESVSGTPYAVQPYDETATSLTFSMREVIFEPRTVVATRTVLSGYILGPDKQANPNRDKPLASEAEAEALRTGKLDKSGGTVTGDLEVVYNSYGFTVKDASGNYLQIKHGTVAGNFWYVNYSVNNAGSGSLRLPYNDIIPADIYSLAGLFQESTTYALNSLCVDSQGVLYRCINPNGHTGAWVAADFAVATVEDVLAALRTAIAGKADKCVPQTAGNLAALDASGNPTDAGWTAGELARYSLVAKTIDNGAVTLDDRAINAVAVGSSLASLTVNFPTATSGKARDFGLRLTVASGVTTAPELALPQGVVCENADGEAPEIGADGAATILYFTETASGVFLVKGEVVQTIS